MLTTLKAGPYSFRGVSIAGVHTSILVPEMRVLLDVGIAMRSMLFARYVLITHGHGDHIGGLPGLLAQRDLQRCGEPKLLLPSEIEQPLLEALESLGRVTTCAPPVEVVGMQPGDEVQLRSDLIVRAFRTHHSVPSLGYLCLRRPSKLRAEYHGRTSRQIARLREAGADIFYTEDQLELGYATDTTPEVFDSCPELLRCRVLVTECTFLDEQRSPAQAHAVGHTHLEDLIERAPHFRNEHVVLMHFSQSYSPAQVHEIVCRRCPPELLRRLQLLAPDHGPWPG